MIRNNFIKKTVSLLLASIMMLSIPNTTFAENRTVVKNASQDTYVSGGSATNGYYVYSHLQVDSGKWIYILFDMSDIKYINYKAVLTLNPLTVIGSSTVTMGLYGVSDHDWEQTKITGENKPLPTERLAQLKIEPGNQIEVDVTRYVRANTSKRGKISFVILEDSGAGRSATFASSERGNGPTLTIDRDAYNAELYESELEEEPYMYANPAQSASGEEEDIESEPFNRDEYEYEVPQPDLSLIPEGTDIDAYTTTRTTPWMVNYHLTRAEQVAAGYYGGDCGQLSYTMDISAVNSNNMIIGLDTCGLFKSENGGKNWLDSTNNYNMMGVTDIRFDPDDDSIIYTAACPYDSNGGTYFKLSGLWKSADGGKSWRQINNFQYLKGIFYGYVIQFSDKNDDGKRRIYTAGYSETVHYSDDGGETWTDMPGLENKGIRSITLCGNEVVACTQDGIYSSVDGGAWEDRSEGLETRKANGFAIDPKDAEHRFCVENASLYESFDSGRNWTKIHTKAELGITGSMQSVVFNVPKNDEPAILYVTLSQNVWTVRYSLDYGKTFEIPVLHGETAYLPNATGYWGEAFRVHPTKGTEFMVSMDGEIYHGIMEEDGKLHMYPSASGLSGVRASDFEFSPDNPNDMYIASIDRGVAKLYDTGNGENYPLSYNEPFEDQYSIREFGEKTTRAIAIDPRDKNRLLVCVGGWSKAVIKESLNGGLSWVTLPNAEVNTSLIEFNKNNPDIIYAGSLISYNNGASWKKSKVAVSAVSPHNPDIVYGMSSDKVYVSYDCGRNWEEYNSTTLGIGAQRMHVDLSEEDKIWLGSYQSGIYVITKDKVENIGTKNGLVKATGGSSLPIMDIAQNPNNPKHMLAGGVDHVDKSRSAGLFESLDGGETWHVVDGVGNTKDIWVIEFHPLKPAAYIGTSSGTYVYEYENYFDRSESFFNDASSGVEMLNKLADKGVVSGYPDGSFKPNNTLTRAEFATFIKNVLPKSAKNSLKFTDVDENEWYANSINTAVGAGIMVGNGGMFRPNDRITHEEALTALAKLLDAGKINVSFKMEEAENAAVNQDVSDYAKYSVYKCFKNGVIRENDEEFKFDAKKELTRYEAAVLIYRVKEATGW